MTMRVLAAITIAVLFVWIFFVRPPLLPASRIVTIHEGATIARAGDVLKSEGVIVSSQAFSVFARLFGGARYGSYTFVDPLSVIEVAWRVAHGDTETPFIKVTIPEGATVREIAVLLGEEIPDFDSTSFEKIATKDEGYLFPETYFFSAGTSPEEVRTVLRRTFDAKTALLWDDLASSTRSRADIITMASLIEEEARTLETRKIVAGILWKRLDAGMPLQVDAVFGYILGTGTINPTFEQLKIDSPYNTYTHKGLPPGPITNPGLDAIEAALHPTATPYWYYLTGSDGVMHYAKTFEAHVANRRYLK